MRVSLLRLENLPSAYPEKPNSDKIIQKAFSGKPLDNMIIIDSHAHIVQKGGRGAATVTMNQADAAAVVERNRKLGVDKSCVSTWTAISGDYELGNQDTRQAMSDFPDEIIGYATLDPNYVPDWQAECRYYYEECGYF